MLKEPKTQMLKELIQCAKGLIVYIYIHSCICMYTTVHVYVHLCVYKIYLRFEHVDVEYCTCIKSTCIT